jgi:hypothetical protein
MRLASIQALTASLTLQTLRSGAEACYDSNVDQAEYVARLMGAAARCNQLAAKLRAQVAEIESDAERFASTAVKLSHRRANLRFESAPSDYQAQWDALLKEIPELAGTEA